MLLDCLLSAYPENGLTLYHTLDYWEVKDLLFVKGNRSKSPEVEIQECKNEVFNEYLNAEAYKKTDWEGRDDKANLFDIVDLSRKKFQDFA
jgi:hypothetical protein